MWDEREGLSNSSEYRGQIGAVVKSMLKCKKFHKLWSIYSLLRKYGDDTQRMLVSNVGAIEMPVEI